ncbi:hypothetical protein D9619_007082 [Psilocybe cf. subviscida]|uniref:Carboxylic ester hydrolase n=1 Tax=Psilocybe cf. subviscida TaxID=2480587 RepID=A0A8H5B1L1_9AGAR|nr:hypothetical protein D9619_007082 [Psilocybe cf. subviscida]
MLQRALLSTILLVGASLASLIPSSRSVPNDAPVVRLNYGAFQGNVSGDLVQFLGMPFAAPPVGHLRFALPAPPIPFKGIRNATSFGAACFQQKLSVPPALPFSIAKNPVGGVSEDCLFINVVAPASASRWGKLPVIMWIFGGGFEFGDTSGNPGDSVVARSIALGEPIIYVSANYRLNAFGFLGGKELKNAGLGNIGLRDQRFAMEWIQTYILSFGGDPKRVTIWGESSGAWSVGLHHVINNGVQGQLFSGGIMESGAPPSLRLISSNQPLFDQLVVDTGCKHATNALECLRSVPYTNLTAAINRTPDLFSFNSLQLAWEPTIDGMVIKRDPMISVQKRLFSKVPIISGNCDDEGTLFATSTTNITTDADFLNYLQTNYQIPQAKLAAVAQAYPADVTQGSPFGTGTQNDLTPQYKRLAAVQGDLFFQAPRRFFMQAMSRTQKTYAFLYKRGKVIPFPFLGAFHISDIPEFYGTVSISGTPPDFIGTDALVNFVNTLDPNTPAKTATNSSSSLLQNIKWLPWGSSLTQPPMLTFTDPAPSVSITFDTYRKDAMNILNDIVLERASQLN